MNVALRRMVCGGAPLFEGLHLEIAGGEVVAVIGRSGVGKTTLLRLIGGLEAGFEGSVSVGRTPAEAAPAPGYVFQDARLLPWLDATANIRAVAPEAGDARIAELLAGVGLAGRGGDLPHQLSGGMQRRLGLARALAVNPRMLLLDEPFVSLDAAAVADLHGLFLAIFAARRPTVVLVSHDPADAARLADRAVVIAERPARIRADLRFAEPAAARGPAEVARHVAAICAAGAEAVA